jgi:Arc/MetJ-type ribon-helix-helix transcriptional regulator
MGEYWHNMPKASAATRSGLYKPVSEVVRETLRLLEIGYESGYNRHSSRHIMSNGAVLAAQSLFNV